jgi:hypothetical protein
LSSKRCPNRTPDPNDETRCLQVIVLALHSDESLGKPKTRECPVYQINKESPMKAHFALALAGVLATIASPSFAKMDCDAEFRAHMSNMSPYLPAPGRANTCMGCQLAELLGRSVDAYKACKAGDEFSPHGVWDKVLADAEAASKSGK